MVLGLRPSVGVFVIWWLSLHQCFVLANGMLLWRFRESNTTGPNQLMECETLNILLSPQKNDPSGGKISYFILTIQPGGNATMSLVGHEPSSLKWTIQHPAGSQIFVALLDSLSTSFGVLPSMYTIVPGSVDCVPKSESPDVLDATQPRISSTMFGRIISCGPWELSIPGGNPTYTVSIVTLELGRVYHCPVRSESGERVHSFTSRERLSVQGNRGRVCRVLFPIVIVNTNGTLSSNNDIADAADTPSAGTLAVLSKRRLMEPSGLRLHQPPRPTAFGPHRSITDHTHMLLSRGIATINSSYADTVVVAVCVSLGGTGIVAMVIYAILKHRRRQKNLDAQDTTPRPFEVVVPAGTVRNASTIPHDITSGRVVDISPRTCSRNGGGADRGNGIPIPVKIEPLRRGSPPMPTPTTITPIQSQHSPSRNAAMQFDTSLSRNRASPYHLPPGFLHTPIPSDPQSRSGSRMQPGTSSSSIPLQPMRAAGVSTSREGRSAKRALWLSRSANDLYSALSTVPIPESGPQASSGHTQGLNGREPQAGRPTNHLRHWHSATQMHQGPEVTHDMPPPYHKLVGSGMEV